MKEKIEIEDNGGEEVCVNGVLLLRVLQVETQDGEVKEKEGEEIITKGKLVSMP